MTCRGKFATVYTDPGYRAWQELALPLLKAVGPPFAMTADQRKLPVRITVAALFRKPKTSKLSAPRGDLDNIQKGLWDTMTKAGHWWVDDNQIVDSYTTKAWAEEGDPEGYRVRVEFLETAQQIAARLVAA